MTRTLMVVLLVSISAACFGQDDPLLFRASFDKALTAEVAGGNPEAVWARGGTAIAADETRGSCARVPAGGQLLYDAPGNVYWERGTVSFWWLCEEPIGQTEFTVASLGSFDHFYYGRWLRLYALDGQLFMHIWDWHYDTTRLVVSSGEFRPQQGQWYHVALGWDAAKGFALYVDGERIGSSDRTFYMPLNINQIGLGVSAVASHARATSTRTLRFDEARVYDRWLDDAQIAALAAGEDVREGPPPDEAAVAAHRIASLNLDGPGIWRPQRGRTAYAAQPQIVTARDVLRTQMTGVDGKLATQWPSGRRYTQEGFRYDVEMAGEEFPVNHVSMIASHTGAVQIASGGETRTIMERSTEDPFVTRAFLDEPIVAESAHVTRAVNEEDSRHDGAMWDLQLLQVDDSALTDDRELRWVSPAADPEALGDQWRVIKGEYPPGDQTVFAPAETGEPVDLPAMRTVHIVSDPAAERTVIGVIRLGLFLEAPPDTVAHLELFHPLNYTRRQMMLDFVPNEGPVELVPRPLLLEPGQRLRLTLQFTKPVRLSASAKLLPRDEEQDEYFADQMRMLKMYFMRLSEARPWGWDPTNIKALREFYACMDQLRALRPDDERVAAYHNWTRAEEGKPRPELPATPAGVPEWAWYQVRLLELCKRVPQWWIENRQVDNGEFGSNDGPNDDSVLVQDFAGLHLMDGPDEMLLESARKVGLMTWARTMEDGINRQVTDPLHAYEWGANVNNMLAVMDYGDPRWIERMMEIGQHYERLTGINAAGHRHYRSNRYGAGEIVTEGRYGWDQTSNALNMQAGALLGWYNAHPESRRYMTEWVDAWMEDIVDPEDGRGRAAVVDFATDEKNYERLLSYGFPLIAWACYDQTGDERYLRALELTWESDMRHYDAPQRSHDVLQQLVEHTDREDIRANLREVIAGVDLWGTPIRYTDARPEFKYLEWLLTGDESAVTEALKATLSDMIWELPMYTAAEQSPDRLWLPQAILNHMMLGDVALLRNRIYPLHWVSWEGHGGALAAWVLEKRPDSLRVWLVNTSEAEIAPVLRAWRLAHGRYEVRLGTDDDGDGRIDGATDGEEVELGRGMRMALSPLPARRLMVLEIMQTEALEPLTERADLAIAEGDLTVDPATGAATLTVHNIGARDAGAFTLRVLQEGREEQAEIEVSGLAAPQGFVPSRLQVALAGLDLKPGERVNVTLDAEDAIAEITEDNNRAVLTAVAPQMATEEVMHPVAN